MRINGCLKKIRYLKKDFLSSSFSSYTPVAECPDSVRQGAADAAPSTSGTLEASSVQDGSLLRNIFRGHGFGVFPHMDNLNQTINTLQHIAL